MTINTSNYTLDFLPAVPLVEAFSYVGPNDLSHLSMVNKRFCFLSKENSLWKLIANKISLPLTVITDENTARIQVRTHILSLKKEIKNLREPLAKDVAKIIASKSIPSYEEIKLFKDYRKARGIIAGWSALDGHSAPMFTSKEPAEVTIARANKFTNWFKENKNKFTNLTSLEFEWEKLSFLPSEFCQLTQLQKLSLEFSKLFFLPSEFCQLTQLQKLSFQFSKLSILPSEICQLTQLQILSLYFNKLYTLPAEIGQLTQLRTLLLNHNHLSTLPAEIGQLTLLKVVNLSNNQLSTLPSEIGQLSRLRSLYLDFNQLSTLPSEIGQLSQLQDLKLSYNQLSSLPLEIGQLSRLRSLSLDFNHLSTLPAEIGQLNLGYFSIARNPLSLIGHMKYLGQIYKKQISYMEKAAVGMSLATLAYYYPTEIISGTWNSLPYVGAVAGAVAIQKLVHRYF